MLENAKTTLGMTRDDRFKLSLKAETLFFPEATASPSAVRKRQSMFKSESRILSDESDSDERVIDNNPASTEAADDNAAAIDYEDIYGDDSDEEEDEDEEEGEFDVAEQLPPAITAHRKVEYLLDLLDHDLIDLEPSYQREVVWTPDRQTGLINSMNENFYIPPLIFNVENRIVGQYPEDVHNVRVCVDGKQRLSSILRFVKGLVPCSDKDERRWWWNRTGGRSRKLLGGDFKNQFLAKELFCIEYNNLTFKQQEDLFGRVQKGMVLTVAEKLKAQRGPWQDLALDIEKDFKDVVCLSSNRRASGFRNVLTVAAQIMELKTIDTKMDIHARNVPALQNSQQSLNSFVKTNATTSAINLMTWIFRLWDKIRLHDPSVFKNNDFKIAKRFSPMEFIAVGVLLFKYGAERNLTMLSGDISSLRAYLRENVLDIHTNSPTWRVCWQFIDDLVGFRGDTEQQVDHDLPPVLGPDGTPTSRFRGRKRLPGDLPLSAILARAKHGRGLDNRNSSSANVIPPKTTNVRGNDNTPGTKSLSIGKGKRGEQVAAVVENTTSEVKPRNIRPAAQAARSSASSKRASRIIPEPSEEDEPRAAQQNHAPRATMTTDTDANLATAAKRKRLSVKTADGASQLLFKRKKGDPW
ncbi:MAG: hypothetical protein M1840_004523 [Geoglossum simile]|nr:MAG: hypothetical protein M1840_004523 [Geoglossum simile]